jgi:hypothetical protein
MLAVAAAGVDVGFTSGRGWRCEAAGAGSAPPPTIRDHNPPLTRDRDHDRDRGRAYAVRSSVFVVAHSRAASIGKYNRYCLGGRGSAVGGSIPLSRM